MPALLVPIISAVGASLGGLAGAAMIMYASEIAIAAVIVGGLAYSSYKARAAQDEARQAYNAAQTDRMVNVISATAPRELVLGRVRKAGTIFYRASTGSNSQDLYLCIALAGHEVDAIETIYLNDVPVTLDGAGNVTTAPYQKTTTLTASGDGLSPTLPPTYVAGTLTTGTYGDQDTPRYSYQYTETTSYVRITQYLGAPGQSADPDLIAAFPADWSGANTVQGVAYLVVRLRYSESAFPSGVPAVSAVVRGARLYDPRSGLTAWSQNPALMMRHVYTHPRFGKASSVTAAEDARFTAAANACDTSTVYTVGGVAQPARALYQAGIVVPFGAQANNVLDDLAQAMGGSWAFAGGAFYLKAGSYTASVMTLTDADLAVVQRHGSSESQHPIAIAVHRERSRKINTVKAKIWDSAQDYKETALTPLTSATLLARDGAELVQEITLPAVNYAPQALHIAGIIIRDARDPLTVQLPFKLSAYPLELFDTVSLTLSRYGWSGKTFMVIGRSWGPDGSIALTLKETTAAIVAMDAGFAAQGFAANTNLPSPWAVATVTGLSAASGTAELQLQADGTVVSRLRITWPQHPDIAVLQAGQIEVQYKDITSNGAWSPLVVPGNETAVVTSEVQDGATYLIRARARTTLAVSDWCGTLLHTVLGKTEPPGTPSNVVVAGSKVYWTGVADIDLAGYQLRAVPGNVANWGAGTELHSGLVTASPYTLSATLYNTQTIMVVAVDTSGNLSAVASNTYDFAGAVLSNVADSKDYAALGFAGSVTGGAYSAGALRASAAGTSDLYVLDDTYAQADAYATSWQTMVYISEVFTPRYAGLVSLVTAITGSASIEYQIDGSTTIDAYASADAYAAADLYGSGSWAPWPGALAVQRFQGLRWRITVDGGTAQGLITACKAWHTLTSMRQTFGATLISSAGTRLAPAAGNPAYSAWVQIQTVQVTPVADGSGAVGAQVLEINPVTGPVVQLLASSGTPVAGTATIDIGGTVDV